MYFIYNVLLSVFLIFSLPLAIALSPLRSRYRSGFFQRLGFLPSALKNTVRDREVVWLHAASLGEVFALQGLIRVLRDRFPKKAYLVSTSTTSGLRAAEKSLSQIDGAFYLPLDHSLSVRRVLRQLRPSHLILTETEIWPNLIRYANLCNAVVLLVSGRLSARSYRRYKLGAGKRFLTRVFSYLSFFCLQTEEDAKRMVALGADPSRIVVTGNLKFVRPLEPTGAEEMLRRQELEIPRERAIVVGGSTHAGEETVILGAFGRLKAEEESLLLILAPRHPERFSEVEALIQRRGFRYQRRSMMNGHGVKAEDDVILLDTLGELSSFYPLATVAFVGGSLADVGGHNLLEPAMWRKPVLFGPFTGNMKETAERMKAGGGGKEVVTEDDLFREILKVLRNPELGLQMGNQAFRVVEENEGVLDRHLEILEKYLCT
jgi:3-deoxy-D-manno-octulosonic-acid transferase